MIISSRSAHSSNCKRSVHISELVRRMMNTSRNLSWNEYVVPVLNDYMMRMAKAGYHQDYRKNVLLDAYAMQYMIARYKNILMENVHSTDLLSIRKL